MIPPGPKVSVTLQKMVRVADGMGGFTNTYTDVKTFKGVLIPVKGNEEIVTFKKESFFADYLLYAKNISDAFDEFHIIKYIESATSTRIFKIIFLKRPFMQSKFFVLFLEEVK